MNNKDESNITRFIIKFTGIIIIIFNIEFELIGQDIITYPNTDRMNIGSELVDVSFADENTIDVQLRNVSEFVDYFTRVEILVKKIWLVYSGDCTMSYIEPSATYDVELPVGGCPYQKRISISQAIGANGVDRFSFKLKVESNHIYLFTLKLFCNGKSQSLSSGNILLFTKDPSCSFYYDPQDKMRDINPKFAYAIYNNKKILDSINRIKVVCSSGIDFIKNYIEMTIPSLKAWYSHTYSELKKIPSNNKCKYRIEELINPEYKMYIYGDASLIDFDNITENALINISCLSGLTALRIWNTEITNKGLSYIRNLYKLKELLIEETRITDEGLKYLQGLVNLESLKMLKMNGPNFGDKGLSYLKKLYKLKELSLQGTHITDEGLRYLRGLVNLESLKMDDTNIDGIGLLYLKNLYKLKELSLQNTRITDEGLQYLCNLTMLEKIDLAGTPITIDGLGRFASLNNLYIRHEITNYKFVKISDLMK